VTARILPSLYAIVDPLDTGRDPVLLGEALLAGGARLLQLRLKDATTRDVLEIARELRLRTRRFAARLIVNDRPDIARAVQADGVHLGQDDLPLAAARLLLPRPALIGVSTHDDYELERALADEPDYVAVGPLYATPSKRGTLPPRGLDAVAAARRRTALPLVAIGGITLETAAVVRATGADSVAMIGALVRAPDVAAATRRVLAALSG
jgi:thiamine-phosphate pyrophosphorylase